MKECPFHSRSKCEIWVDYQVACATLQEAEELCLQILLERYAYSEISGTSILI